MREKPILRWSGKYKKGWCFYREEKNTILLNDLSTTPTDRLSCKYNLAKQGRNGINPYF